ncbi:Elongator complex protein 2 [Sphaceloma murrayae]|uniref:Elongator complex protein 2 n=1 Tax=Sphaceloma murrayae TaxID=2082308 RepID=A0A2K1QTT7_9PEZI|nr:Elongator complex protein 2 [Sphaceloma murrayae]
MPISALRHLRSIEMVIPPLHMAEELYEAYQNVPKWLEIIDFMYTHLNISTLTMVLHVCDVHHTHREIRSNVSDEIHDRVIEYYRDLFRPLQKLRGMKAFFADVAEPLRWQIEYAADDFFEAKVLIDELKADKESELEELVMGPDYDAGSAGKTKRWISQWLIRQQSLEEYL